MWTNPQISETCQSKWRWHLFVLNICTLFYLHSHRGQCLLKFTLRNGVGILLGLVYEVEDEEEDKDVKIVVVVVVVQWYWLK